MMLRLCHQIYTKAHNHSAFICVCKSNSLTIRARLTCSLSTSAQQYSTEDGGRRPLRSDGMSVFKTALNSVMPQSMVKKALQVEGDTLIVEDQEYKLNNNIQILAFGKAVAGMVRAAEDVLAPHVKGGVASISLGLQKEFTDAGKLDLLPTSASKVELYEGAKDNLPDNKAQHAAMKIYERAQNLGPDDLALVLISGGGSPLLPAPIPPITIEELHTVTKLMFAQAAEIKQVNTVRKQLELLKGGGLAQAAAPAKVISLILSDVINDPLDFIASGPTTPNYSSPQDCIDLFQTFQIMDKIPVSVKNVLEERHKRYEEMKMKRIMKDAGEVLEDDIINRRDCTNVQNVIVGSNKIATKAAEQHAQQLGYVAYTLSTALQGECCAIGELYAKLTQFLCHSMGNKARRDNTQLMTEELNLIKQGISKTTINELRNVADVAVNSGKPICIIGAGETVVKVTGSGVGGRNQEIALSCAQCLNDNITKEPLLKQNFNVELLSIGTDGRDGPCDMAGAIVNNETISQSVKQGLNPQHYMDNNDSYNFFAKLNGGRDHVNTGLTGTNVMDLQFLMIQPMLY